MAKKKVDGSSLLENGVDFEHRIVYLGSLGSTEEDAEHGVNWAMSRHAICALAALDIAAPDGDKPITAILNSPGGDQSHGMAIYDAISNCKNDVTILVYGMAMSMGSLILQAGTKRVMAPNAQVMIHYGTASVSGHPKTIQKWVQDGKKLDKLMEDTYLAKIREKHPRFTRKKLQSMLLFDTILTAREAVELGLADAVLGDK